MMGGEEVGMFVKVSNGALWGWGGELLVVKWKDEVC